MKFTTRAGMLLSIVALLVFGLAFAPAKTVRAQGNTASCSAGVGDARGGAGTGMQWRRAADGTTGHG